MWDEEKYQTELAANKAAYERLKDEIRTRYAGQYVGMAFGRVVATDPDVELAGAAIDKLDPQPLSACVFQAGDEPAFEVVECYYNGEFIDDEELPPDEPGVLDGR